VPTCPERSVHDVVAHLGRVVDDVGVGRLDGVATEAWTRAQVDARRGEPIAALVQAWDAAAPAFEHLIDATGTPGHQTTAPALLGPLVTGCEPAAHHRLSDAPSCGHP